jgi:hypothetical protein
MQELNSNNLKNNLKRKPQWGNAAWKAAALRMRLNKGRTNRRICKAIARHSGMPCGQLAMAGVPVCRFHGGHMMQARNRSIEAKRNAKRKGESGRFSARQFRGAGATS